MPLSPTRPTFPEHPTSPSTTSGQPHRDESIRGSSGKSSPPPIYLSVLGGGSLCLPQAASLLAFPSSHDGWSLALPDSISCPPHPRRSGRLPGGAPFGHICSWFGKQQLNSSAELTACSPRQFASCSAANASLAFQGDVNSAAFKG